MIAFQVPPPPDSESAYAWFALLAVIALGALFLKYDGGKEKRSERAEKQVDDLTADNKAQTATMRDLADQQETLVDLVEKAVSGVLAIDAKMAEHHRYVTERFASLEQHWSDERRKP
jgi:hypothetical protein